MNRKQSIVIAVFLGFCCQFTFAQESERYVDKEFEAIGKKIKNNYQVLAYGSSVFGGIWRKFNKEEKKAYLMGCEDGSVDIIARHVPEKKREIITMELPSFYGIGQNTLIKKLDDFYANLLNFAIPLPLALIIIRDDVQGRPNGDKTKQLIEFYREELDSVVSNEDQGGKPQKSKIAIDAEIDKKTG